MNIQDKNFTVTASKINFIRLEIEQDVSGNVTATGILELLDVNNNVVKTISQPLTAQEINKWATALGNFKTWLLSQNGIVLT